MNKLALKLRRLTFQFPEFRQYHTSLEPTLVRLAKVKVADARDTLAPGISGQQMDFIMDISFESMFNRAYREGYVGSISKNTIQAFQKFGEGAEKALLAYALDPANVENVRWDLFYLSAKPFDTSEADAYEKALAEHDEKVAELQARYDRAMTEALMSDTVTLDDVKAPEFPAPPKPPKASTKLDKDAEFFIQNLMGDMDSYSYELFMHMDGHGSGVDELDMLFRDSYKAAKTIGRQLQKAHQQVQDALYDDMSESVEKERVERRIRKVEDLLDPEMRLLAREAPRALRGVRDDKDAKKMMDMLKSFERNADPEGSLETLKKLQDLLGKMSSHASDAGGRTEDLMLRDMYSDIEDSCDELESGLESVIEDKF